MTPIPYLCYIWNEDLLWLLSRCIQHFKFITKVTKQTWTYPIYICTDELQEKVKIMSNRKTAQAKGTTSHIQPCPRLAGLTSTVETFPVHPGHWLCSTALMTGFGPAWAFQNSYTKNRNHTNMQWNVAISTTVTFGFSMFFQNNYELTVKTISLTELYMLSA